MLYPSHTQTHVFVLTHQGENASFGTVIGTISISRQLAFVLIDYDLIHSFVSPNFSCKIDLIPLPLESNLSVATPFEDVLYASQVL